MQWPCGVHIIDALSVAEQGCNEFACIQAAEADFPIDVAGDEPFGRRVKPSHRPVADEVAEGLPFRL